MADDKSKRGTPDNDLIAINDPDEVRNWTKALKCTKAELLAAVKKVGPSAKKVRAYLAK
jgi:hypothetical protein